MAIYIKTREQIEKMKIAGAILARLDDVLKKEIKPGVTTKELDIIEVRALYHLLKDMEDFLLLYVHL